MAYLKWLKEELKSINTVGAVMLSFITGVQLAFFLTSQITMLSIVTLLATLIGSACTVYMMLGKPINGLFGLISALGFIYINMNAGHYASVLDQCIFILLIDIPLIISWQTWHNKIDNGVKFLTPLKWLGVFVAIGLLWYPAFALYLKLGDTNPLWDSLTLIIGAVASILVFRGFGDSYSLWLLSNIVTITLWVTTLFQGNSASSLAMILTLVFYTGTAIYGRFFSVWSNKTKSDAN